VSSVPLCPLCRRIKSFLLLAANCGGTRARQALSPPHGWARHRVGGPRTARHWAICSAVFRPAVSISAAKLTYALPSRGPPSDNPVVRAPESTCITSERRIAAAGHNPGDRAARAGFRPRRTSTPACRANRRIRSRRARARCLPKSGADCEVVLLGSVASPSHVDIFYRHPSRALLFPIASVGAAATMSRGGLLPAPCARRQSSSTACRLGASLLTARGRPTSAAARSERRRAVRERWQEMRQNLPGLCRTPPQGSSSKRDACPSAFCPSAIPPCSRCPGR